MLVGAFVAPIEWLECLSAPGPLEVEGAEKVHHSAVTRPRGGNFQAIPNVRHQGSRPRYL
jgi:hypothetical protein